MNEFADARAYDRFMGRWSRALGPAFVRFAGVADGSRVLDVGCGTGSLSACVLSELPTATVVGVDPSPGFIAGARLAVPDARARFEVGSAMSLGRPEAAFDAVVSLLVLNFVPDPAIALAEFRRVTRAGGCIAACVWDYGDGMEMLRHFWDAAVAFDAGAAERHEARMPLCRAGELRALWAESGLTDVREQPLEVATRFASFADYWEPFLAGVGPAGAYAAALPPAARGALAARLRAGLWNNAPEQSVTMRARAWAVVGTEPGTS
ncbi:MAG TPA: class I SAM-dependent methyltransferase [Polyangiaceae bacterium]|nr:class I SAM-dependent methyltransferase [Polyangiaceae bacterium]